MTLQHPCKWTKTLCLAGILLLGEVGWIYLVEQRAAANETEVAVLKTKLDYMCADVAKIRLLLERQLEK